MTATAPAIAAYADDQLYRVLLVEDDEADALLVEELLHDTGLPFRLTVTTTLADACAELVGEPADCILLDLHLPDASGPAAVATVRASAPHTAVVVLTGLSERHAGTDAMAAGAQDYLVKGKVEPDLLRRTVRYAVYRSRSERAAVEAQAARLQAQENKRLERGLLPQPLLETRAVTITTRYLPGREQALLGGDFLDAVEDDGVLHGIVGDVSGHGPDAAALGVCLRIAWRSLVLGGHRGAELLRLLDRILSAERREPHLFATCALITLDQGARTATLHLAGHDAPLLSTDQGTLEVSSAHGIALGIAPELGQWPQTVIPLPATGGLTLYTDGLTEGYAGDTDRRLGVDGLLGLIDRLPPTDPGTHVDLLIKEARALNAGRHTDDLAVLRLDWGPRGPSEGS
ncbi:PP2C family protein-serine/threonine phosphatase [Streptomyces venezuelae]|uniref:PP2C family protein-serine/threonine phosphatase n=1 Tax=Streptomyces venezuelae TaxID=54571 RepID=UPI00278BF55B|nr:SpoIIE family protein phosphatase [Streptomyces venezuelae]